MTNVIANSNHDDPPHSLNRIKSLPNSYVYIAPISRIDKTRFASCVG